MASLYRIVADSDSRLALEGRKLGLWILTLFLFANGLVLLYVGLFVMSRRQLFPVIAGSALGAFLAISGVAVLISTLRYGSRIEFDRDQRMVRLRTGRTGSVTEIPFAEIASVEIETKRTGSGRSRRDEHRLFLLDTDDSEWLIDRSTDAAEIAGLADRIRFLTSGSGGGDGPRGAMPAGAKTPPAVQEARPDGVSIESDGDATVYRWRMLPRAYFWVFFWGFVTLFLGGLGCLALVGVLVELARQPPGTTLAFLTLAALTLGLMYAASRHVRHGGAAVLGAAVLAVILANLLLGLQPFIKLGAAAAVLGYITSLCAFVLLARCRLRVATAGLDYEERILGLPLWWRRHSLAAAEVDGFRIKAAVRGGGAVEVRGREGRSFTLMIPQGTGAFSRRDLEWLREQWLSDLAA
jgi:hypothetical protein